MSLSQPYRDSFIPPESETPARVIAAYLSSTAWKRTGSENVALDSALGRVISADFKSPYALPTRPHTAVDGYAIRLSDLGAFALRCTSAPRNGRSLLQCVRRGEAIMVLAGDQLPPGCDTVVPVGHPAVEAGELRSVPGLARGSSVIAVGSDVEANAIVIAGGSTLSIADIGTLAAFGLSRVDVRSRPTVALITADDSRAPHGSDDHHEHSDNVSRYVLSAALAEWGARVLTLRAQSGNVSGIFDAITLALAHADAVIVASDSPPNQRRETADAIEALSGGTVVSEGVSMTPGTCTVLGAANGIPILGIPGAAVAALLTLRVIGEPVIRSLSGRIEAPRSVSCILRENIVADRVMETVALVHVDGRKCHLVKTSTLGSAPFAQANGFVRVPAQVGQLCAGAHVLVESLDGRRYGVV